jgi:hypothetical protein
MNEPTAIETNEPIQITLTRPIPHGDSTLAVLTLRRPKAGDFRGLKGVDKPFDMILDFTSILSGLTPVRPDAGNH